MFTAGTQQLFREKNAMLWFKFVSYCAHEKIVKKSIRDSSKTSNFSIELPYIENSIRKVGYKLVTNVSFV